MPDELFARVDESDDGLFYTSPRLVLHIDDATVRALTAYYAEILTPGAAVLDLMSSWSPTCRKGWPSARWSDSA